ncbi:redox-regulated ATPase YchF [Patescibacteria group bacterium]|nr:redox-regulated ATPase YchF [Patescibacteria group bacterium]MBU1890588.1 redox-regulated ATPase YchF [Patescibacteria group bacterium]
MSFSIGIVGLPNVGKSTLFQALTRKQVNTSNHPFCTIDPNVEVVAVPDNRLKQLTEIVKPKKIIPTTVEFYDIAGLVKGAHKGEGLGNMFLSNIRRVDAIGHMIRNFESTDVTHISGAIDPISDALVVNLELIMSDLSLVDKHLSELKVASGDIKARNMAIVLKKLQVAFKKGEPASDITFSDEEKAIVNDLDLLTSKPMLYIVNQDEDKTPSQTAEGLEPRVALSAKTEAILATLSDEEQKKYKADLNIEGGGLEKLIHMAYKILDLITFYTIKSDILQARTIPMGTTALEAAGRIHTDLQTGFIKAEVISSEDLIAAGSEASARDKGQIRAEGKDYGVKNGDVINIVSRV